VTENEQVYYCVCLVIYMGNPVIVRDDAIVLVFCFVFGLNQF